LDDVFKHVVLDGSLEEMRTVTTLLKKGGEEGQKAYAALQGQTIQHLKNQLEKNTSGNLSYDGFSKAIKALDREGKLDYMFGKKGRETLIDLQGTLSDALVPIPGSVNTSNSGNVVTRTLNALVKKLPLAKDISQAVENQKIKKQVEQSIKFDATKVKP